VRTDAPRLGWRIATQVSAKSGGLLPVTLTSSEVIDGRPPDVSEVLALAHLRQGAIRRENGENEGDQW
jgi:hypothetical protein